MQHQIDEPIVPKKKVKQIALNNKDQNEEIVVDNDSITTISSMPSLESLYETNENDEENEDEYCLISPDTKHEITELLSFSIHCMKKAQNKIEQLD